MVDAVRRYDPACRCSACPARSCWPPPSAAGLRTVREAFADRGVHARRARWSRGASRAPCCTIPPRWPADGAAGDRRARGRAVDGTVGRGRRAESICVHGDTPGAVAMAARGPAGLAAAGVELAAFARDPPDLLPCGDRAALLVELGDIDAALAPASPPCGGRRCPAWRTWCRPPRPCWSARPPAVDVAGRGVRAGLAAGRREDAGRRPRRRAVVEIPVRYDGPDLADVARLTGLSETRWSRRTPARRWRVAFGGFAPGFGYLVGDDDRLHVPRRDSARTAVPGRRGRPGRRLQRGLPARVARRLAADRHHGRARCGTSTATRPRCCVPGDDRPVRAGGRLDDRAAPRRCEPGTALPRRGPRPARRLGHRRRPLRRGGPGRPAPGEPGAGQPRGRRRAWR